MRPTAWCQVDKVRDLTFEQWLFGAWGLALALGILLHLAARRSGAEDGHAARNGWVSAGFALMTVPVWMVLLDVAPDFVRTFCAQGNIVSILPGRPAAPPPAHLFSIIYSQSILQNLGYIALGALLVAHGRDPTWWRRPTLLRLAQNLRDLIPMGRGEGPSLRLGVALFPILAGANLALIAITGLTLQAADKSPFYTYMTPYHAVMMALAAAFGEELVYRGVIQQGILRLLPARLGGTIWLAPGIAIVAQAIPFAYAHADYGDPQLLLFAFLFAALAGIVARRFGIWCAIALHALIDFYAFFVQVPEPGLAFLAVVAVVSAGIVALAAREGWRGIRWINARKA